MYNIRKEFIEIYTLHQELWESTKFRKPLKGGFITIWLIIINIDKWPLEKERSILKCWDFPTETHNEESDTEVDTKAIMILHEMEDR